jgi:hypothetical protein
VDVTGKGNAPNAAEPRIIGQELASRIFVDQRAEPGT